MARSKTPGLVRRGGPIWHYDIVVDGLRYQGSTHTSDLKLANLALNQVRLDIARGQLALPQDREVLLLKELHEEFLGAKRAQISPLYLASLTAHWKHWINPILGSLPVTKVHLSHIDDLRNALLAAKKSQVFTNDVLISLRTLLNFGVRRGKLKRAPKVELLRVQKKPRPTVPATRISEFLSSFDRATQNPHARVMVRVMVGLGCRSAEVAGMRWEWLDFEQHTYTVGKAKGKEARVLPVPGWLWQQFENMPKTLSGWIFPSLVGKIHAPGFLRKPLIKAANDLKLGALTSHRLRATFASLHAEAGTPITEIQGMLGHKNIATTMIYVETSLEAKRKAQDALSQRLGLG
jgi:integrase